jgi:hypothetical protein
MRARARATDDSDATPREDAGAPGFGLDSMFDRHQDVAGPPTGRPPRSDGTGSRSRWLVVLAAVLGIVIVVGAALGVRAALDDDSSATTDPEAARVDVGRPPVELPVNGSAIRSRVRVDGDVVVTQWIRSKFPVTDLGVRTPPDEAGAALVGNVTVVADGRAVAPLKDAADPALRFTFLVPAELVRVRYVLTRAVARSPSVPGRALVRSTFLRTEYRPLQGPTVVTVTAPEVLSMTCSDPRAVLSSPRPCGSATAGGWRVTLRANDRQDEVMAQVDLRN